MKPVQKDEHFCTQSRKQRMMAQFLRLKSGDGVNLEHVMWWNITDRGIRLTFANTEMDEHGYSVPVTQNYTGKDGQQLKEYFAAQKTIQIL